MTTGNEVSFEDYAGEKLPVIKALLEKNISSEGREEYINDHNFAYVYLTPFGYSFCFENEFGGYINFNVAYQDVEKEFKEKP